MGQQASASISAICLLLEFSPRTRYAHRHTSPSAYCHPHNLEKLIESAGARMDHEAPRERRFVAV
jgi:hypothetical protein